MFGIHFWFSLLFSGEIGRLRKFWLAGACHSKLSRKQTSDHLGILNFTSAFILLAAGIVLGGLLLFLEHLYFRFGRKCLKQYDKCGCCALVSLVCTLICNTIKSLENHAICFYCKRRLNTPSVHEAFIKVVCKT